MEINKENLIKQLEQYKKTLVEVNNALQVLETNRLKLIGQVELLTSLTKTDKS